ncbi:MAG: hypothetical protein ABI947_22915 [Chloroflexota bacterium]
MNSPQFPTNYLNIPQAILDHYHAHYNNTTYRAFSDALAASLPRGTSHPDHVAVMNLLIDAAFERSGAEVYSGASVQLGTALMTYANPELFTLAEQHLRQFNQAADETVLTAGLLHTLETLRALAESAVRAASDHHGWRGRVAFWWLSAIAQIAQATYAVLSESHSSYVQEKLTTAIRDLHDGLSEGAVAGLVMAHPVMQWFTRFPLR